MTTTTTIRSLAVERLDLPLFAPFGIAGGAQDVARNLLVTVELGDGTRGYGEAAPFPVFNGETQEEAQLAIEAARSSLEGADVREWRAIAAMLRASGNTPGSARCALETAVLDALTRHAGLPLWSFFGGVSRAVETDMTIGTGSAEDADLAARQILERGITMIKVKIGGRDMAHDLARLRAIHAAAPESPLMLDGNGGMRAEAVLELIGALREGGIHPVLLEQPVPADDWDGLRRLAQSAGLPVAADETASSAANVLQIVGERAAQVVNIKLMKTGVAEALDMAAITRAAGLRLMIGSLVESSLATTMSVHFAAGQGGFAFVDLDMPMFLAADPFCGGFRQAGARLDVSHVTAGHGVVPDGPR